MQDNSLTKAEVAALPTMARPGPAGAQSQAPTRRGRGVRRLPGRHIVTAGWWMASLMLFAGLWEIAWATGLADPLLLPPPHVFLRHIGQQARYFLSGQVGQTTSELPGVAVLATMGATMLRVLAGLAIAFVASLVVGVLATYLTLARRLMLPVLTMLAPVSPVAWLPVAIFVFGIGNAPAVFMVFIGLFFVMSLATVSQIESVSQTYLHVARTMGASRGQILWRVVLPAILPGLFVLLRLNLFAAWIVVLVAEAVGVGTGLGQIVMLARNTFNPSLVFFTMTLIGIGGYIMDVLLRTVQRRLLWWQPSGGALAT